MTDQEKALQQLNEEAEKYCKQTFSQHAIFKDEWNKHSSECYKQGALSPEAANGCNKHVEKAKIEFAIECLECCININCCAVNEYLIAIDEKVSELSQKLKSYK